MLNTVWIFTQAFLTVKLGFYSIGVVAGDTLERSQHVAYKQMHYKIFLAYTYYYKEEEKLEF